MITLFIEFLTRYQCEYINKDVMHRNVVTNKTKKERNEKIFISFRFAPLFFLEKN